MATTRPSSVRRAVASGSGDPTSDRPGARPCKVLAASLARTTVPLRSSSMIPSSKLSARSDALQPTAAPPSCSGRTTDTVQSPAKRPVTRALRTSTATVSAVPPVISRRRPAGIGRASRTVAVPVPGDVGSRSADEHRGHVAVEQFVGRQPGHGQQRPVDKDNGTVGPRDHQPVGQLVHEAGQQRARIPGSVPPGGRRSSMRSATTARAPVVRAQALSRRDGQPRRPASPGRRVARHRARGARCRPHPAVQPAARGPTPGRPRRRVRSRRRPPLS